MASTRARVSLACFAFIAAYLTSHWYQKYISTTYIVCSKSQNIYTVHPSTPNIQCISVRDSRIVATGSLDDIVEVPLHSVLSRVPQNWITASLNALTRPEIKYIPENAIVVPGLADGHAHIMHNGYMKQLPLNSAKSVQDVVDLLKHYIDANPVMRNDRSRWIEGMGWDQTKWSGGSFPAASDLDRDPLLKDRPILLQRIDGHAQWVSPVVLEMMGTLPEEVEGGKIVRGSDGKPTGVFVDNAMKLIPAPVMTEEKMDEYFKVTMQEALSTGLTSIHDAGSEAPQIGFFKRKAERGELPMRLYLMGSSQRDDYWGNEIPRLINYGKHGRLNIRSIKLFSDGALGSWGAAMLRPYSDKPDTSGFLLASPKHFHEMITRFHDGGWQVNVHCIGDRANHVILDIFEELLRGRANISEWRHRIEHAQIFDPSDLERIGRLGVIPSVQPTHATSDMWYAEDRLGPERIKGAYAYQTLLSSSPENVLVLGTDFPVEGVNPLLTFYAAVTRLSVDGQSPHGQGGWFPEQRLSRSQALKGMTLDAAYASFAEHELGSLVPGKKADFVVFDRDIMKVPVDEILQTKVIATVVDGEVAYGKLL